MLSFFKRNAHRAVPYIFLALFCVALAYMDTSFLPLACQVF